jgi:alkanesulfonate monooxygenase SsuD/methylene tetrahydromethanopterin reductase-like flavin-dependent oxidoreductase (luciferase family)
MAAPDIGVIFLPQLPPERLESVARLADDVGLGQLWLWEDCFRESGIASASAVLAWTERLHVGVGLLPAPLRNVALTAMEVATLSRMFPGRFQVGIGHGVLDWMGQVGARVESPMTLLREYVSALRDLLDGKTVTVQGRYVRLDDVTLDWPPERRASLLVGAGGPRTVALSAKLADGTILSGGTPPDRVAEVHAVAEAAGRPHGLTVYLMASLGPGAQERMADELRRWSLDPSDDGYVAGDAAAVAAAVRRWAAAGATTVVLQPTLDEDLDAFIRAVAADVRPLL